MPRLGDAFFGADDVITGVTTACEKLIPSPVAVCKAFILTGVAFGSALEILDGILKKVIRKLE